MFDPKIVITPSAWWIIGGVITGIGVVIGTTVKIMTRDYIHRKEVFKTFQTMNFCNERYKNIESKLDNLKDHISDRFDDLKCIIEKTRR